VVFVSLLSKGTGMSGFDRLVTMISKKNTLTYPLTRDNVAFGNPAVDNEYEWNTRLNVHGIANKGYRGQVEVFYTRVNMSAMGNVIELMQEDPWTVDSMLAAINRLKTAQITTADLSNAYLPMINSGEVASFQMSASLSSLVWLGNVQIRLLHGIPAKADELADFLNNRAAGLF
jgi:hypothetical protein